jgi:hypothetical protein
MAPRETFLLIERQALVLLDMEQAIHEISPRSVVLQARDPERAIGLLRHVDRLTGAVSGLGFDATKRSGLGAAVADADAWLICLNGRHEDRILAAGWHPLGHPFRSEDLQGLIRSLSRHRAPSPAAE